MPDTPTKTEDRALCPPAGVRIYAIGDIHGELGLLEQLQSAIDDDLAAHPIDNAIEVTLGDYIDRGPDSRGVIHHLSTRPPQGRTRISLMGNHEDYLVQFLDDPTVLYDWLPNGGVPTLTSYGVNVDRSNVDPARVHQEFTAALPQHHRAFITGLQTSHRSGDVLLVHAGIRPTVPLDEQTSHDLMWIRRDFLAHAGPLPVRVVHGHTPVRHPVVLPYRISVDTGAFATGVLTCCVLEGDTVRFIQAEQ